MFKRALLSLSLVACHTAVVDDARSNVETLALTVATPICHVATTTDDYPLTIEVDTPGRVSIEAYAADGTVRSLVRADVTPDKGIVNLPAGSLTPWLASIGSVVAAARWQCRLN